ncbi:hypothetical protein GGTG_00076 [Gaeumannomyces tritici R3-111a-1]|uniref:Uncharacterized protein n=1 Tax=Gaeumannomyces tritici (strain R3-111a-1) TaxID=644352 RepID=J3NFN1_GAET3|nr:hypothetical protein GGTG_00076 [Gaeumannomyces tritici R3-111a-1]EJT80071.1 hypothetical protein GGTG_00076 [Gaeumannomyces tritici R3-111a-1]
MEQSRLTGGPGGTKTVNGWEVGVTLWSAAKGVRDGMGEPCSPKRRSWRTLAHAAAQLNVLFYMSAMVNRGCSEAQKATAPSPENATAAKGNFGRRSIRRLLQGPVDAK